MLRASGNHANLNGLLVCGSVRCKRFVKKLPLQEIKSNILHLTVVIVTVMTLETVMKVVTVVTVVTLVTIVTVVTVVTVATKNMVYKKKSFL